MQTRKIFDKFLVWDVRTTCATEKKNIPSSRACVSDFLLCFELKIFSTAPLNPRPNIT